MTATKPVSARILPRTLEIVLRILAASIGAYAVCYEVTAALAISLPTDKVTAVIVSTNLSLLLMVGLALWSFCGRNIVRIWALMLGATAILALIVKMTAK